jgi:uncharacterized membrane protein
MKRGDDEGQLMILIIGYFAIAALALAVVVDASKVFLAQRALVSAADGAAQVAAQTVDEAALYRGASAAGGLPLDSGRIDDVVGTYVVNHRLPERFKNFEVVQVQVAGDRTVVVTFRTRASLPFPGPASDRRGVHLTATAKARIPARP